VGLEAKSEYVPVRTNQLIGLFPFAFASLRVFQTALPATALVSFAPARRVNYRDATGTHYPDLGFAIEDGRGARFNFQQLERRDRKIP
jgi:hypothetical protein